MLIRSFRVKFILIALFVSAYVSVATGQRYPVNASPSATLTVTKIDDTNDGACNADCSLREAIAVAADSDVINFNTNGVFASPQTITLTLGELSITHSLTINGTGVDRLTVSGNDLNRVFNINNSTVNFRYFSVTHGFLLADQAGSTGLGGAGIRNVGDLTLTNMRVAYNSVKDTAIAQTFGVGIFTTNRLTVIDSVVEQNSVNGVTGMYRRGGGIYNTGSLRVSGSTISNNNTGYALSAIGGGIFSDGPLYVFNSTFSGNGTAGPNNGSSGGAIYAGGHAAYITNCTITMNDGKLGSGIRGENLFLRNTIVSGNTGFVSSRHKGDVYGAIVSGGSNIIGPSNMLTIDPSVTGNILNQSDPQLSPLANNGGPTRTHAFAPNSLAHDHGNNALAVDENNLPLSTDQRGGVMARIAGSSVDVGAYEYSNAEITVGEFNGGDIADGGSFDFGTTTTVTPITKSFRITNTGTTQLRTGNVSIPNGFTLISPLPAVIEPNETRTFDIRMELGNVGAPSGMVSFETNDNDENPYNFTVLGVVGSPPVTTVSSIVATNPGSNCTPISLSWTVTFTQPITGLSVDNFAVIDVNNSVDDERIALVVAASSTTYFVYVRVDTRSGGPLRLDLVNRNGTNSVISNAPFTGEVINLGASPAIPTVEPLTPLPVVPGSTGNQITTPDVSPDYLWFITGGTGSITSSDRLQTISYSVGSAGNLSMFLRVTAANGCSAFTSFAIPVYSVTDPVVTNNDDIGPGSLRQAIVEAAVGSTITFANNVRGTITLLTGELLIQKALTIRGPGADKLAISGNNANRIFNNSFSNTLNVEGLTLRNGMANGSGVWDRLGGAVLNQGGNVTLKRSVIFGSFATDTGGAVANILSSGDTTIIDSTIYGNIAPTGGAVYTAGRTVNVISTTISGNSATLTGGGIWISVVAGSSFNLVNATVANNTAGTGGGGIWVQSDVFGNAVLNSLNSLIANNTVTGANPNNGPDVMNRFISDGNNLVGNTAGMWVEGVTTGNILDPVGGAHLAPLGFHGGSTPTHALANNSPAVNAASDCVTNLSCVANMNPPSALTADQRGASRVGQADMGAFELNSSANGGTFVAVLPNAVQNTQYNFPIVASNGAFTYSVTSGALPNGVSLTSSFAPNAVVAVAGRPTQGGIFDFAVTATDGANTNVTNYRLEVLVPSAAAISVGGRVLTADGRGLSNAIVYLTLPSGERQMRRTSSFGYYLFDGIDAGQSVVVSVIAKPYNFTPRVVTVSEDILDVDFVAK